MSLSNILLINRFLVRNNVLKNTFFEKSAISCFRCDKQEHKSFSTSNTAFKVRTKREKIVVYDVTKRPTAELDSSVARPIEAGKLVGRSKPLLICPPEKIVKALTHLLENTKQAVYEHLDEYLSAGEKLRNVLDGRHPPLKEKFGQRVSSVVEQKIRKQYEPLMQAADSDGVLYKQLELETEIQKKIKIEIGRCASYWKQIEYDDESAVWAYTFGKSVYDYACMYMVMMEIKSRLPPNKFQPRTILDFGSGVGTSIWAALEVFGVMNEVFAIDVSPKMNDFARLLLQGGNEQGRLPAGYFFRLHLPRENEITYDLVTSSFTLLDLSSESERLRVIDNLWKKTNQFLILIEIGTNAGFQVLAEARHYLTSVCHDAEVDDEFYSADESSKSNLKGHLFAPCPHEVKCPRYHLDNIPCNFDVKYRSLYFDKMPRAAKEDIRKGKFSYLVFRKGPRTADCSWPRITSEPLDRHNHVICRMCSPSGKLQELVAVKSKEDKSKKQIYRYAKRLKCGDQFKVHLTDHPDDVAADDLGEVRILEKDFPNLETLEQTDQESTSLDNTNQNKNENVRNS